MNSFAPRRANGIPRSYIGSAIRYFCRPLPRDKVHPIDYRFTRMEQLPLFVNLRGKRCLIAGGGAVAARKAKLLLRAGADITVVATAVSDELKALGERLTIVEAPFSADLCRGAALVIAATDRDDLNRQVAAAARMENVWCNVVDDPVRSTCLMPAIVDRSPVVVAIGTAGTAPVLARRLKRQIESWLPGGIGALATQAGRWRQMVKRRFPTMRGRLRFWQRFFDGPVAQHLLAGRLADAERGFRAELLALTGPGETSVGEAYIVGAGPGDPELLTLSGLKLLSEADIVLYDALVSAEILDFARKDATLIPVGKRPGESAEQCHINALLVRLVESGRRVCRLKGGDPMIFGRGGEEADALAAAGLPYRIVPGISAAVGCAAAAGIPLTRRGVSSSVTFATAIVDTSSEPDWTLLARPGQTLAIYMTVRSLDRVTTELMARGMPADTPATVVEKGTTPEQRIIEADLASVARTSAAYRVRSPAILFVGDAVAHGSRLGHRKRLADGAVANSARDRSAPAISARAASADRNARAPHGAIH